MTTLTTILKHYLLPPLQGGRGVGLLILLSSCTPEPPLHLYDSEEVEARLPQIDLALDVYWDYELEYGIVYDWRAEWEYGWDDEDQRTYGNIGYSEPTVFNLRRYYTGDYYLGPHLSVVSDRIDGHNFRGRYNWGFWDLLVWNEVQTLDGVQSLHFDESSMDSVVAYTNQSMTPSRYQAPRYTHAFYEPEALFSAYEQGIEINRDLRDFEFDSVRNVYWRKLNMVMQPITYIYLTQIILHNNRGRVTSIDGNANLSGMARSTNVNTGRAGSDAITVHYSARMKNGVSLAGRDTVDIIGGRLLSFGLCSHAANSISSRATVTDPYPHYMDVTMQFNNATDSTFVFDVTEQVRQRYKGGVITMELDMDTVPIPSRKGGSGFNAVVKDFEEEEHEFGL